MTHEIAGYCVAALAAISSTLALDGLKVQTHHFGPNGAVVTFSTKSTRELSLISQSLTREVENLANKWSLSYFIEKNRSDSGLEFMML